MIPSNLLAAEREEAKAVLILFLKKHGLGHAVAARTINKSDSFIDHLVSRLHSVHKSRYLVGPILMLSHKFRYLVGSISMPIYFSLIIKLCSRFDFNMLLFSLWA